MKHTKKKQCLAAILLVVLAISSCSNNHQESEDASESLQQTEMEDALYHITYADFERENVPGREALEYKDKTLVFQTCSVGTDEDRIGKLEYAVNEYLDEKGYDFSIKFELATPVEHVEAGGFENPLDLFERRLSEGKHADLIQVVSLADGRGGIDYYVEQGYLLNMDDYLDSDEGEALLQEINRFITETEDRTVLDAYMETLRAEDGSIYCLPARFDFSEPYIMYYTPEYMDYYGVSFGGTLDDVKTVMEHGAELCLDGIAPLMISYTTDMAALNMAGYECYDGFVAICPDGNSKAEAVDFFENEELISWYCQLGEYRKDGYITYGGYTKELYSGTAKFAKEVDSYQYLFSELCMGNGAVASCGITCDKYGNVYDAYASILDVPNYVSFYEGGLGITADTRYPAECFQFLELFYGDMDFRNLFYYGIEGYDYYVDAEAYDESILVAQMNSYRIYDWGLQNNWRDKANLPVSYYSAGRTAELESNQQAVVSPVPSEGFDVSVVESQYLACKKLFEDNALVFVGYYEENTEAKLEELHQKMLDAGLQEVLDCINNQL